MEAPSDVGLTPRERDLVNRVVAGYTDREIARELGLTEQAVKNALSILYEKCEVRNRLDLVLFAVCCRIEPR